jgi:hypothetical protein
VPYSLLPVSTAGAGQFFRHEDTAGTRLSRPQVHNHLKKERYGHPNTAEVYGSFTNEEIVGEALAPIRNQAVIATKFGFKIDPKTGKQIGMGSRPRPPNDFGAVGRVFPSRRRGRLVCCRTMRASNSSARARRPIPSTI